ncbi:MAG TPA: hypothetical protein VIH35_02610 [Kiritimatiellia bacterium]|jgi:hypothetical protein
MNGGDAAARRGGHVLTKVVILVAVLLLAVAILYYMLYQMSQQQACGKNLQQIHRALQLYEIDRGTLPRLAFFPDDAKQDRDSLRVVLEPYGADGTTCECPSLPDVLSELGLTYVWNVALNGKKTPRDDDSTWMLVEICALTTDVPAPHMGQYNVLYTDGKVRRVKNPTQELTGL